MSVGQLCEKSASFRHGPHLARQVPEAGWLAEPRIGTHRSTPYRERVRYFFGVPISEYLSSHGKSENPPD